MKIRPIPLLLLVPVAALSAGCGPSCQNTCNKIYQPSECNIERAGRTPDQLVDRCLEECEGALANPGPLGTYDPQNSRGSADEFEITTDHQAAAWMDCVTATSCENLQKNFCPPIW
jgi:hypothetical protein